MKALTVWQPWATLIAIGAKRYETRSWATPYRGLVVIHAGRNTSETDLLYAWPFWECLSEAGYTSEGDLPFGAGLCVARLVDVKPACPLVNSLSVQERQFGDYRCGRFAWKLDVVRVFNAPIPEHGQQGLWDWEGATA